MQWPRQLLAIQTAVSAAEDDLDRALRIVLQSAIRMVPASDGGEIELRDRHEMTCRAACGDSLRKLGERTPIAGSVPGFSSMTMQDRAGLRSTIIAPIPFHGEYVGQIKLHSRTPDAFGNSDLLALQLLAWLVVHGIGRHNHARDEQAKVEADRRFQATFDQAAVGIAHVSPEGQFILVNDKFCKISGWGREELIERGFQGITHPDDLEADLTHVRALLDGRSNSYTMEKRYLRNDGSVVWINLTVSLVCKLDGKPDFFVSVIEDISARRAAELDAELDPLTGLLNRRGALRRLRAAMDSGGNWQNGVAAAFLDLDGFKSVNDKFGHEEGDRCLVKVAAALRKALRSDDVIARMGGDEFLALFPASSEKLVMDVLSRLQRELDTISEGEPWNVGASLGVAVVPPGEMPDPASVIAAADRLMYRAKQAETHEPVVETITAAAA
ncbi:MAG TPA: diguanylate cyclase [Sphingomonadaceae bacterium]|nr:diguanylate cyclase [Sphingomonadaceae bacterium]